MLDWFHFTRGQCLPLLTMFPSDERPKWLQQTTHVDASQFFHFNYVTAACRRNPVGFCQLVWMRSPLRERSKRLDLPELFFWIPTLIKCLWKIREQNNSVVLTWNIGFCCTIYIRGKIPFTGEKDLPKRSLAYNSLTVSEWILTVSFM